MTQGNVLSVEWINMQKLAILGISKEYVYIALFLICILVIYSILRPLIQWLLLKHSHKLLTYIISSLCMLVLLLLIAFLTGEKGNVSFIAIKNALLTLTMFGLALFVLNFIQLLLQKWLKKSI